ncbi:hypothetical protein [Anaerofustis stercorihominis]|uniref:Uncharacterized protein n=1 Tax=Anaerofustis stercorihominis TaxID=214853 RepID=A0A3E3DX24_9FIRM|nr:hypothetical protein [Anaerofustis stercorihominis]RGD73817.1 hypothetical protein DW687_08555 [Anaerofustis stercorihominis]
MVQVTRTYENIRGVDFSKEARNVIVTRSPDMVNMWKDYNSDDEAIVTREGFNIVRDFNNTNLALQGIDKKIYGIHFFEDTGSNHRIYHVGPYLIYEGSTIENDEIISSDMNKRKSISFMYNKKLYILDGRSYYRYYIKNEGNKLSHILEKVSDSTRIQKEFNKLDGTTVTSDSELDIPFVPITTMSRAPLGGGDVYQQINILSPYRKNAFIGDSTNKVYSLDTTGIDGNLSNIKVWINDTHIDVVNGTEISYSYQADGSSEVTSETKSFKINSVDAAKGTITFNNAPPKPLTLGESNIIILFKKEISGYADRINKCTMSVRFDNRFFFSGNDTYRNAIFHSELNNPEYIGDLSYYQDGADNEAITSLCVGGNVLWVFKDGREGGTNLYYHTASSSNITLTDSTGNTYTDTKKSYPMKTGKSSFGAIGFSCNFSDDICFLTGKGIYGLQYSDLSSDIYSENFVCSRSKNINKKLLGESNFGDAEVAEYKGYMCILVNGHMYLADSRATFKQNSGFEYEWFYFEHIGIENEGDFHEACYLKSFTKDDEEFLYFGTKYGELGLFSDDTFADNGVGIESYFTTKADNFDIINHLKNTNKRGSILKMKTIPNSSLRVYVKNNKKEDYKFITQLSTTGFDFSSLDFANFTFNTDKIPNYLIVKNKQKKFNEVQYKIAGEGVFKREKTNSKTKGTVVEEKRECKPFGFYSFTVEAIEGGYIKR